MVCIGKYCVGTVNALLGGVVMRRPGIVRRGIAVLAGFVVLLAGCAARVEPLPVDALPLEVFETYVRAIQANDERAGQAMSGDCWFRVSHWFERGRTIGHYEISADSLNRAAPPPQQINDSIFFKYWTKTGKLHEHMVARLERDDEHSPWRVCQIVYRYAP